MSNLFWDRQVDVIFGPVFNPSVIYDSIINNTDISTYWEERTGALGIEPVWSKRKQYHFSQKAPKDNAHISDLRITFNIKKTVEGSTTNKATIKIYNISRETWKILEDDKRICQLKLYAGYKGLDYTGKEMLHYADITNSYMEFNNGDWIGVIETGDADFAIKSSIINKSYASGFKIKDMVTDTVKTLLNAGVSIKDALLKIEDIGDLKQKFGSILSGDSAKILNLLLPKLAASWHINNQELIIKELGYGINEFILMLTPYNGLLDSPKKEVEGISFRTLLIPDLDLDSIVKIESKGLSGYYIIEEITYVGDTHGNNWECRCKGKEYKRPTENLEQKIPKVPDFDVTTWINNKTPLTFEKSVQKYKENQRSSK